MISTLTSSWGDMGFYRLVRRGLFPKLDRLPSAINNMASAEFDIAKSDDFWWIRDRKPANGSASLVSELFRASKDDFDTGKISRGMKEWENSRYSEIASPAPADETFVAETLQYLESQDGMGAKDIEILVTTLNRCPYGMISELLETQLGKYFFRRHPRGQLRGYMVADRIIPRSRVIRGAHLTKSYPEAEIDEDHGFGAMSSWQRSGFQNQLDLILTLGSLAFYPHLHFVVGGRLGLGSVWECQ